MRLNQRITHKENGYYSIPPELLQQAISEKKSEHNALIALIKIACIIASIVYVLNITLFKDDDSVNPVLELRQISGSIAKDNMWTQKRVDLFIYYWDSLKKSKQYQLESEAWFQTFSSLVSKTMKTQQLGNARDRSPSKAAIRTLAHVIGIRNSDEASIHRDQQAFIPTAEMDKFESQFDESQVEQQEFLDGNRFSTSRNNKISRQKLAKLSKNIRPNSTIERRDAQPLPNKVNLSDIDSLLAQFSRAYSMGNTAGLMELFSDRGTLRDTNKIKQLNKSFRTIFNNSSARKVKFANIKWQYSRGNATGTGRYIAKHTLNDNKGLQKISAEVRLDLRIENNQLQITNFSLMNPHVELDKPRKLDPPVKLAKSVTAKQFSDTRKNKKLKSRRRVRDKPTASELFDIVNRYTIAYEEGDIRTLLSLFSFNIRTNTNDNIMGVQENYTNLFETTSDRQMFIRGLKWTIEDRYARGVGDIEMLTIPKNGENVKSTSGKIQIIAKIINNKLTITHMYNTEHTNK